MTARQPATLPEPERWTSRPDGGTSIEDQLAGALRTAAEVSLQAPATAATAPWVPSPVLARRRRWSVVLGALLAGAGGVVWATVGGHEQTQVPPTVPSPVAATAHSSRPNAVASATPGIAPQTRPRSPPAMPGGAVRPAAPRRMVKAPLVPTPPQSLPPSETEVGLLSAAYHHLRVDRDAAAALVPLEEYARRFPTGALLLEADVARVEALLMLGRRGEALRALEALPPRIAAPVRQRLQLPVAP
jgi:hypothetical protein